MIKAVLLDMDNTLLTNPDRVFAKAFLTIFETHMHDTLGVEGVSLSFREAIKRMSQDREGNETNTTLTVRTIHEATGKDLKLITEALDSFYREKYPSLHENISPVDGATQLIQNLIEDFIVVIATNPLYPHTAIKQRMKWGNLPVDESLYALITSADNMHYAKPHPAYFTEILSLIEIEAHEAVVVGDSQRSDIIPAQSLGCHTFHIETQTLADFSNWLKIYKEDL